MSRDLCLLSVVLLLTLGTTRSSKDPTMTPLSRPRLLITGAAALLTVVGLSGCTAVDDLFHGRTATDAETRAEIAGGAPSWVPEDASDIRTVSGDKGDATSILLVSADDLDPDLCTETARTSAPTMEVEGAPDVYDAELATVFSCGDWTVAASPDGWYGWTPATEDAAAPTPTPAS